MIISDRISSHIGWQDPENDGGLGTKKKVSKISPPSYGCLYALCSSACFGIDR